MESMRKCTLCPSHKYKYCSKCKNQSLIEPWRFLYDTETCRDVYHILSEFAFGRLSAPEAKEQLSKYNVPPVEEMQKALAESYNKIMESTKEVEVTKMESSVDFVKSDNEEDNEEIKPRRRRSFRRGLK